MKNLLDLLIGEPSYPSDQKYLRKRERVERVKAKIKSILSSTINFLYKLLLILISRYNLVLIIGISEAILIYHYRCELNFFAGANTSWLSKTAIATLIASPIAFLIWSFRNHDKKKDQQHTEENIRQSDFHKLEEWATTLQVGDSKNNIDKLGNKTLQISAIYQLVPFLKGEYGERFMRPTMEIYRSLLSSWRNDKPCSLLTFWRRYTVSKLSKNQNIVLIPDYIKAIHTIFREESEFFRNFHNMNICKRSGWIPLKGVDLKYVNLQNVNLNGINLEKANLTGAILDRITLINADLKGINLSESYIMNTSLRKAKLQGAILERAFLLEVELTKANLLSFKEYVFYDDYSYSYSVPYKEVKLKDAILEKINLTDALIDCSSLEESKSISSITIGDDIKEGILTEEQSIKVEIEKMRLGGFSDEKIKEEKETLINDRKYPIGKKTRKAIFPSSKTDGDEALVVSG